MSDLDLDLIAKELSKQFGLQFSGTFENIDGGRYIAIRPDDLPKPNGFCITIARTPKIIEASFCPDSFSGSLIRKMGEVDQNSTTIFENLWSLSETNDMRLSLIINGEPQTSINNCRGELWCKFELDCDLRLPLNKKLKIEQINNYAIKVASVCISLILSLLPLREISEPAVFNEHGLPEGSKIRIEVNKYERNPINRMLCIAHYGAICTICDFNFREKYGLLGENFIEVHHIVPVSHMGNDYSINPIKDLVPICSNCHSMIHRKDPPIAIEDLKSIIKKIRVSQN